MTDISDSFLKQMKKASNLLGSWRESIRVFGQYDADGITATSIFIKALLRESKTFHSTIWKQLTKSNLEKTLDAKEGLLVFIDFGSGQLEFLNKLTDKKIIIVDHHQSQGKPEGHIIQVNPLDYGINENISASGASYLLAKTMDNANKDLAELAIIGAIGDSQAESDGSGWGLTGINREILKDAQEANKVSVHKGLRIWGRTTRPIHKALEYAIELSIPAVSGSSTGAVSFLQELGIPLQKDGGSWRTLSDLSIEEQQKLASGIIIERASTGNQNPEWIFGDVYELLNRPQEFRDASEFATMINACGKLGKPYLGVQLCLGNPDAGHKVKLLLDEYRKSIGTALSWIETNKQKITRETENGIFIFTGSKISEHIISNIISILHKNSRQSKPIFGVGESEDGLKVSARATDDAVSHGINLKEILSSISVELGGEGGGHAAASGATIPTGTEDVFVERVDSLLKLSISKYINTKQEDNGIKEAEWVKEAEKKLYGQTGRKEIGAEGEGKGAETAGKVPAIASQTAANKSGVSQKMERKGLVQYFSS